VSSSVSLAGLAGLAGLVIGAAMVAACGTPPATRPPAASSSELTNALTAAFREEARGDPAVARKMYLSVLDRAAASDSDPWQLAVVEASLDALVQRSIPSLSDVTDDAALAFRTPGEMSLDGVHADGPFVPGLVARAMLALAERRGDAAMAERYRQRSGCAREATVIGPLTWTVVTAVTEPDPLAAFDAKIEPGYSPPGPFGAKLPPVVVRGRGCSIDLTASDARLGVRDVVVDVDVPSAQSIGVALRAQGAAILRAGGTTVLSRPYELGGSETVSFARVFATKGRLRLVARVGMDEDGEHVELDAWDMHGAPLVMHAPSIGEAASVRVRSLVTGPSGLPEAGWPGVRVVATPTPRTDAERLTAALAALANGASPVAERLLEHDATSATAPPDLALAYARAVEVSRDLPLVHRAERARAAYERVIDVWPTAWEAIIAHAGLAGVRRGRSEARIETLKDLDLYRPKAGALALPMLDAFDSVVSGKDELAGRARAAFERAKAGLGGTALLVDAGRSAFQRVGAERVDFACEPAAPHDQRSLECYEARRAHGDLAGAAHELERIRMLRGGPDLLLAFSMRDALASGDQATVARLLSAMLPGEVTLSALYTAMSANDPRSTPAATRARLLSAMLTARDSPAAVSPLLRALRDDPATAFEGVAADLAAADRAHPILPSAATAILAHKERYVVSPDGVTHAILFDVRRVSGTTDVEENAQAEAPTVLGRTAMRILRRRILKKDGRVVEPERAPHATQSHADLSQLEAGDIIEAIYEAWSVPDDTGDIGIDTPDMLPERSAVHEASIEIRLPKNLKGSLWSHPLMGKGKDTTEGNERVLSWTLKDAPARRIEDGTPKMDRSVSVSFSTGQWSSLAQGLREALASLDDHDPGVAAWAQGAAAGATGPSAKAKIEAVTIAAGAAVRESSTSLLSDIGLGHANGPQSHTCRTILANHEGSRTWLIVRALRELHIPAEVVIAETDPFSADPAFPPHIGRFMHPLAIATAEDGPLWIDADVPGPPLPAGRVSPELRGRNAIHPDGTIVPITVRAGGEERDEIDLRLVLDAKGNAKGTFTIVLRGREAQEMAEALNKLVGDDRQRALRGVALAWVPFADVDDVALSSSEGSWQVAVRADLTIGAYGQIEGTPAARTWVLPGIEPLHTVYPRAATGTLGATYVSEGQRQTALAVSRAVQYHAHRRVELPPGATIARMPGPFEVKAANLEALRHISVNGSVIEDEFTLGVSTGTVSAEAYPAFLANAHHADDAFLASTRVRPPP
jgi:hypothetical protein